MYCAQVSISCGLYAKHTAATAIACTAATMPRMTRYAQRGTARTRRRALRNHAPHRPRVTVSASTTRSAAITRPHTRATTVSSYAVAAATLVHTVTGSRHPSPHRISPVRSTPSIAGQRNPARTPAIAGNPIARWSRGAGIVSGRLGGAEIPGDQRVAPEQRADGPDGEKRPERNRRTSIAALHDDQRHAHRGTGQRCDHQGDRHRLPAEERADHRQQLDVAAAHALAAGQAMVDLGDAPQYAAAEQDAGQRRDPGWAAEHDGGHEADANTGHADRVGNDLVVVVDEGDDDQRAEEGEREQRMRGETERVYRGDG